MAETKSEQVRWLNLRANVPRYVRIAAIALSVAAVCLIAISFIRSRGDREFRMKGFPTALSKDVVASVEQYERTEYDGGRRKYYVKADRATTFSDNHQELENVFLQVFGEGELSDKLTAAKAVYVPEDDKSFTAYLAGNVSIETRDALSVKTEQLTYRKSDESAAAEEAVEFSRGNIGGRSFGAHVKVPQKVIELLKDVEIRQYRSEDLSGDPTTTVTAGDASYDQLNERIQAGKGVKVNSVDGSRTVNLAGGRAVLQLAPGDSDSRDIMTAEVFDSVAIESFENGGRPTQIRSGYAQYDKPADRFDLREAVHIVTVDDGTPTKITASRAVYEQTRSTVDLNGQVELSQGVNFAKGDNATAILYPTKRLRSVRIIGAALVRQAEPERTVEISGAELNATFADGQALSEAHARGTASAVLIPSRPDEYSKVSMTAPRSLDAFFRSGGVLERMATDGRTTIQLDAPGGSPDAANKRLTADTVKSTFSDDGKTMQKAEAVGNAELFVEPLTAAPENYKTTVNAARFDCLFYPTGNSVKNCTGTGGNGTRTVRVPTVPAAERGIQTLTAAALEASFNASSRDVERLDASGGTKFTELDRNGIAANMAYTSGDGLVRLRGGEPTVWDSRARAKAKEIDWDTKNQKSYLRAGVSTTYYSQKTTGGATPFSDTSKPVYITSESAEFDHRAETALYKGNARGWQEKSYVRADRFHIKQKEGQFDADGKVQSLLYDVKRKENGRESIVPVSASSNAMSYIRDTRLLRYTGNVDVRQASERIIGGKADIFLNEGNEIARSEFQQNVVITQPGRRATADFANYNASDESVILRGSPVRVEDAENGNSQAGQMTIYLNTKRVAAEGRTTQNTSGRTRSVYKVKEN